MEKIELKFSITEDDWKEYNSFITKRLCKKSSNIKTTFLELLIMFVMMLFAFYSLSFFDIKTKPITAITFVIIGFLYYYIASIIRSKNFIALSLPKKEGSLLSENSFIIDSESIKITSKNSNAAYPWEKIYEVIDNNNHIYLMADTLFGIILPKDKFKNADEALANIVEWHKNSTSHLCS